MSRFPDFMHADLTRLTCGGCALILLSVLLALGTAVGGGVLLCALAPGLFTGGKPDRWLIGVLFAAGLVVGAGFYQAGRMLLRGVGLRFYRDERDE